VRDIIDEYLVSMGIDPKIPPTPIFDEKFELKIKEKAPKAKAEELKHAITDYIEKHEDEDPELYGRFSEKGGNLACRVCFCHVIWQLII
jgi:type I restriction enzyme R subunit